MVTTLNGASVSAGEAKGRKHLDLESEITKEIEGKNSFRHSTSLAELLASNKNESIPWLVEGLIQEVGIGAIAGASDIGKTTVSRQLAINIASNDQSFLDWRLDLKHGKSILVYSEDLPDAVAASIKKQIKEAPKCIYNNLRFIFDADDHLTKLDEELTTEPADLVVLDCFADLFGGDLKDTQQIRKYLGKVQGLATKHRCFFLFVHHTGKRTENLEPSKNNLLSGQGLEAKLRLVIEMRSDIDTPSQRHLCVVKGNYLSEQIKKNSYVLDFDETTLTFTSTGERTPFRDLLKSQEDEQRTKYMLALRLKEQGYSYEQIASQLNYANRGSVSKLFSNGEKRGWRSVAVANNRETDEK